MSYDEYQSIIKERLARLNPFGTGQCLTTVVGS